MKICLINTFYYPEIIGGAELSVQKLAEGLLQQGHEVHVICCSRYTYKETINNVVIHRVKFNNIYNHIDCIDESQGLNKWKLRMYYLLDTYNVFNYSILSKVLQEINPDVLHVNNLCGISTIIWTVAKKLKIPIVQTLRDYYLLKSGSTISHKFKNLFYKKISENLDCVTAPSNYTLYEFIKKGYFKNSYYNVVYNAIDYDEQKVSEIVRFRKQVSNDSEVCFVFLGRLEEYKGIRYLIESFKNIENDNIKLFIAGDGSLRSYVIDETKKDKRITYLGFISEEERDNLLQKCDVLVIPSLWPEPFGRVIIEAYKYGIPVIGCDCGGISEIIKDNETGKLISLNHPELLFEYIRYFSERKNIIELVDNCLEELKSYSIHTHINNFLEVYERALNSK